VFPWREADDPSRSAFTAWSIFKRDTKYFEPSQQPFMLNYRVDNLSEYDHGRFAWLTDPEGNRIELWEPPASKQPVGKDRRLRISDALAKNYRSQLSRLAATNSSSVRCGYSRQTRSISSIWPIERSSLGFKHQRPSSNPCRRRISWMPAMQPLKRFRQGPRAPKEFDRSLGPHGPMTEQATANFDRFAAHLEPRKKVDDDVVIIARVKRNFTRAAGKRYSPDDIERLVTVKRGDLNSNDVFNSHETLPEIKRQFPSPRSRL
jgi:hypothetical protein